MNSQSFFFARLERKWWVVIAMAISLAMTFIDQTAVAIALPKIQETLHSSAHSLQWVIDGYLMTLGIFLIFGGRFGDLFHHHKVFYTGLAIFTVSSLICSIAMNINWLIAGRVLQGFGAAFIVPNSSVIIISTFEPGEKGKAMGIYMGTTLIFLPIALLLGGIITQYFSWRLIFWINLPLAIICFLISFFIVKLVGLKKPKPILDWLGLFTFAIAITSLVFALMERHEISSIIFITLLVTSFIFFIICYYVETRRKNPLIDFSVFNNKLLLCAAILIFCMSTITILFVFSSIFYQNVLGYKPVIAGLLFLPDIFSLMITAPFAGKLLDKRGYKIPVLIGLILVIFGFSLNSIIVLYQNYWYLLPGVICIYVGSAFIQSPIYTTAIFTTEETKQGIASGILNATRQISASILVAFFTSIIVWRNHLFLNQFVNKIKTVYPNITTGQLENLLGHSSDHFLRMGMNQDQINIMYHTAKEGFTLAFSLALSSCALLVSVGLISAVIIFKKVSEEKKINVTN